MTQASRESDDIVQLILQKQAAALGRRARPDRPLKLLFTIRNGEHRIQINGRPQDSSQALRASNNNPLSMRLQAFRADLASAPEAIWKDLLRTWRLNDTPMARRLKSLSKEQQLRHWREYSDCPHREEDLG
jgi:hypothetical protein